MGIDIIGLTNTALGLGFELADQLTDPQAQYKRRNTASDSYSVATGAGTPNETTITVTAMLLRYKEKDIDGEKVRKGDEKILIRKTEMTGIAEPTTEDTIVFGGIVRYIIDVTRDATGQLYTFQTNRTKRKSAA